ncbi:hypothetical protein [Phycicoccus sp. Soil748]|uniref:hypothetical protein n=1 Tax=Phycicoccus sp. Soil748 TaxID=1736397 RepID=UPI000703B240|nr:hypothetical protein [Phycicoccus sp. Soil748]KRE58990.1 hypothetical protein ASG70_17355 [Phycicoccus sp. Soil748]
MTPGRGRAVDLVLRLMDHQLVGPSGALLGNVDDVVLREDRSGLLVVGLVTGPGALGPRQPGLLGRSIVAAWRRLDPRERPRPLMVPMSHVRDIGSAVTVSDHAERVLHEAAGLEQWLRQHVIGRIPGAKAGDDRLAGTATYAPDAHEELDRPEGTRLLSTLVGAGVVDPGRTSMGTVCEVRAEAFEQSGPEVGRLRVTGVVFGPRTLGGELGYRTLTDQGSWPLARGFRWWHRDDHEVPWGQVDAVDWEGRRLVLRGHGGWRHPLGVSGAGG